MNLGTKNILLADDHFVVRQGLKMLLNYFFKDFHVEQASNFEEIKNILSVKPIDLLILDASFPEGNSIKEIKNFKNIYPELKVLIYTALEEDKFGTLFLNQGADGFLSKLASENEIKNAVEEMLINGSFITRTLKDKMVKAYLEKEPVNPLEKLSEQEFQVMLLLVDGSGNLEICNSLNLKPTTVTTYKNRIYEKLRIKNLPELIELFKNYN